MYDWISDFEGCAFARKNSVYYLIDERGQVVGPNKFSAVHWDREAVRECPQVFIRYEAAKDSIIVTVKEEKKVEKSPEPVLPKARVIDKIILSIGKPSKCWTGDCRRKMPRIDRLY